MPKRTQARAGAVEVLDPTPPPKAGQGTGRAAAPIRLDNPRALRLEMARVYRQARAGLLDTSEASRLVYILGELRKAYEADVLEARIEALEGPSP